MFEVGFGSGTDDLWCWPTAWFARGVAGAAWLPVDRSAATLYLVEPRARKAKAFSFPDAIADCAISPADGIAAVSCWDGRIYLLENSGKQLAMLEAGGPARLAWSVMAHSSWPVRQPVSLREWNETGSWVGATPFRRRSQHP
jgi:hypothetical protein